MFAVEVFHQYDSMAYPHIATDSNVVIKVFKLGWDFFTGGTSSTEKEICIPDQNSMQSEALRLYMKTHDVELKLCQFQFLSIKSVTEDIMIIFHSLHSILTWTGWGKHDTRVSSELAKVRLLYCSDYNDLQ